MSKHVHFVEGEFFSSPANESGIIIYDERFETCNIDIAANVEFFAFNKKRIFYVFLNNSRF
jgi:helix-turn-helix protein